MKLKLALFILMSNQVLANNLPELARDLGKLYQKTQYIDVRDANDEKVRKHISSILEKGVLHIALSPLREYQQLLESQGLIIQAGHQLMIIPSETFPTLKEGKELQFHYLDFIEKLATAENLLKDVFYSSSPYQNELETYQKLSYPLQGLFSSSIDLAQGYTSLEGMIKELESLGLRWKRKVLDQRVYFEFDQTYFKTHYHVEDPACLTQPKQLMLQILQGPGRKLNSLRSSHRYISHRYGLDEFSIALKEFLAKLK